MFASSASFACWSASSGVVRTYALRAGLKRSILSRYARVSSVEEISRRRTPAAWSSADANGSIAVNGADSDGSIGRGGHRALEHRRVLGWNRDQQAAARLRVAEHQLIDLRDVVPIDLVAIRVVIATASARKEIPLREVTHTIEERDRVQLDVGPAGEIREVADQPVAGDVRGCGRAGRDHRLGPLAVEG